jgi:hypothetical protein
MARTTGSKNKSTLEYVQLYDALVLQYGCPVTVLFKIANGRFDKKLKIQAASALIPYRFAKRSAEPEETGVQGELTLVWADGEAIAS